MKFWIHKEGPFFWMFVGEDNYKAVKHKKKETEGDSVLEGKCLWLLMVMENKKEKYGHSLLEGKCLLLWHRKMRERRCTLSWGGSTCDCNHCWIIIRLGRQPNIYILYSMHTYTHSWIYLLTVVSKSFSVHHPEIQRSLASSTLHWLRLTKPATSSSSNL